MATGKRENTLREKPAEKPAIEEKPVIEETPIKEIDDKFMTIDDFLDNI